MRFYLKILCFVFCPVAYAETSAPAYGEEVYQPPTLPAQTSSVVPSSAPAASGASSSPPVPAPAAAVVPAPAPLPAQQPPAPEPEVQEEHSSEEHLSAEVSKPPPSNYSRGMLWFGASFLLLLFIVFVLI